MPKLNRIYLHNINYNNDHTIIQDLIFDTAGLTTLMNLENGGGKTVINQLCHAPYLRGKDRNFGKRPFEELFKTSTPSFVIHEWQMDEDAGLFEVGLMLARVNVNSKKNQGTIEQRLSITGFIEEFDDLESQIESYELSIDNKPLKYKEARDYLKSLEAKRNRNIRIYNLSDSAQARQYETRLTTLGISLSQWKQMRQFNQEESGIAQFADKYSSELSLLNNVFIKNAQEKLDHQNRTYGKDEPMAMMIAKEIRDYSQSLIQHEKDLEEYDTFSSFLEFLNQVEDKENAVYQIYEQRIQAENALEAYRQGVVNRMKSNREQIVQTNTLLSQTRKEKNDLIWNQLSFDYYKLSDDMELQLSRQTALQNQLDQTNSQIENLQQNLHLLECAKAYGQSQATRSDLTRKQAQERRLAMDFEQVDAQMKEFGAGLYLTYSDLYDLSSRNLAREEEKIQRQSNEVSLAKSDLKKKRKESGEFERQIARCTTLLESYDAREQAAQKQWGIVFKHKLDPYDHSALIEKEQNAKVREISRLENQVQNLEKAIRVLDEKSQSCMQEKNAASLSLGSLQESLKQAVKICKANEENKNQRISLVNRLLLDSNDEKVLWDDAKLLEQVLKTKDENQNRIRELEDEIRVKADQIQNLQTGTSAKVDEEVRQIVKAHKIELKYASEWLREGFSSSEKAKVYIDAFPLLPYSLIMERKEKESLLSELKERGIHTSQLLPIIDRDFLEQIMQGTVDPETFSAYIYASYDRDLLDETLLNQKIRLLQQQQEQLQNNVKAYQKEVETNLKDAGWLQEQAVSLSQYKKDIRNMESLEDRIVGVQSQIAALENEMSRLAQEKKQTELQISALQKQKEPLQKQADLLTELARECLKARANFLKKQDLEASLEMITNQMDELEETIETLQDEISQSQLIKADLAKETKEYSNQVLLFDPYKELEAKEGDLDYLLENFEALKNDPVRKELSDLEQEISQLILRLSEQKKELETLLDHYQISEEQAAATVYSLQEQFSKQEELKKAQNSAESLNKKIQNLEKTIVRLDERKKAVLANMQEKTRYTSVLERSLIVESDWTAEIADKDALISSCENEVKELESGCNALEHQESLLGDKVLFVDFKDRMIVPDDLLSASMAAISQQAKDKRSNLELTRKKFEDQVKALRQFVTRKKDDIDESYKALVEIVDSLVESAENPVAFMAYFERQKTLIETHLVKVQNAMQQVEQLKNQVIQLIFENECAVYDEIRRMDSGMTITIQGTRAKMLEITLPPVNRDENTPYLNSILEFVESTAQKMMKESSDDTRLYQYVNPQNLFALIVPPGQVKIKVRKIEKHRHELVPWSTVTRLSGAESFLSSCVVMLAMLYYQRSEALMHMSARQNPTAIFMDNPFAYVQSQHILDALLELLENTHTQMIALSKVENAAIMQSFPNIYFLYLKLLQDQKQHLFAQHTKGGQTEGMNGIRLLSQQSAAPLEEMDEEELEDSSKEDYSSE